MNGHSGTTLQIDASPASQSAAPTDDAVNDDTPDSLVQYGASSAQTTVIPLLEREERALRDARAGLDGILQRGQSAGRIVHIIQIMSCAVFRATPSA